MTTFLKVHWKCTGWVTTFLSHIKRFQLLKRSKFLLVVTKEALDWDVVNRPWQQVTCCKRHGNVKFSISYSNKISKFIRGRKQNTVLDRTNEAFLEILSKFVMLDQNLIYSLYNTYNYFWHPDKYIISTPNTGITVSFRKYQCQLYYIHEKVSKDKWKCGGSRGKTIKHQISFQASQGLLNRSENLLINILKNNLLVCWESK